MPLLDLFIFLSRYKIYIHATTIHYIDLQLSSYSMAIICS